MAKTSIEIGGDIGQTMADETTQRAGLKATIAKQRKGARAKQSNHAAVDRGHGPSLTQQVAGAHKVDLGEQRNWQRAYALPSFEPPAGFTYCYIARHRRRHGDDAGLYAALREGWVPVPMSEIDEEDVPTEHLTGRLGKHGEVIGDDTTILMKMPDYMKAQRDAYYNKKRDAATRAVTKPKPGLAEATRAMPLVEDRNDISTDAPVMRARRRQAESETA